MSKDRIDTRTSPFQGRDRLSPSQHMRLGNGLRCAGPTPEPQDETDGVPVIDWTAVHVIFYADKAHYNNLRARIRAWRWYDKQRDGQSGASGVEVGRWVFDCDTVVALDPDRASLGRGADRIWQTRGAAKMYWQIVEVLNDDDEEPDTIPWIIVQPFGIARNDDPVAVSLFDTHCDGDEANICCPGEFPFMASVKATHWSPIDGNIVYTSPTTLTASGFPFTVSNDKCQVLGLYVRKATGDIREYVSGHDGVDISAAGGVITMTGAGAAPFAATDTAYWVYFVEQEKAYDKALNAYHVEDINPNFYVAEATHWSPVDGAVAFTTNVTCTCSNFPFPVDNANCQVLALVRRTAAGAWAKWVNGQNGVTLSAAANVITIAGAGTPFAAGDTYYVYLKAQSKSHPVALEGVEATHWTPNDGTATYLSGVTLTMAGFPFNVDDGNCRILAVVVRQNVSGVLYDKTYIDGHNYVRISATNNILSIGGAGAAPFAATDTDYFVYIVEQEKAYDESADAYRVEEIAPLNDEYTQPAYVINEPSVDAGAPIAWAYAPSADGIIADGYKDIAFQLYLLGGQSNAHTNRVLTVKFQGSNDADAGAGREWVDLGVGYDLNADGTAASWVSTGLTALSTLVDFDNWMHKRIRVAYMWDAVPGADHPGAIVITDRMKAL